MATLSEEEQLYCRMVADSRDTYCIEGSECDARFVVEGYEDCRELYLVENEPVIDTVLTELEEGDTFYDVGGHMGVYSCLAEGYADEVHTVAFEPREDYQELLRENAVLNGADVEVVGTALSNNTGTGHLREIRLIEEELEGKPVISFRPGDEVIEDRHLPLPNVMKVDVESHELKVLQGMENTLEEEDVRAVYCELHPKETLGWGMSEQEIEEMVQLLERKRFQVEEIEHREDQRFLVGRR